MNRTILRTGACALAFCALAAPALAEAPSPIVSPPGWAQTRSDLSADPAVRFGVLANGMRYAILHNETPSDGVSMRLAINAGSMMEHDNERGLMHFLEHMSFRGSTNVPDGEVVRMLERRGLSFGADTNAGTSQDRIVYMFDFPKADPGSLADGFAILRDIASRLTIDSKLVEAERGVVLSEERVRDTAQQRLGQTMLRQALAGTRAPERFPIGTVDVLKTASADRIRRLYEANFRPENATLVIVGNVDPAAIEREIKTRFSDWKGVGSPDVLVSGAPAATAKVAEFVATGAPDVFVLNWTPPIDRGPDTAAAERAKVLRLIGTTVFNNRVADLAARAGSPILGGGFSPLSKIFGVASLSSLTIAAPRAQWREALDAVTQEQRDLIQNGPSAPEVARAVAVLRTGFQTQAANAASRKNADVANALIDNALNDEVFTSPAQDLAFVTPLFDAATPAQVGPALRELFPATGPVLMRAASEGPVGEPVLKAALAEAYSRPLAARAAEAAVDWPYKSFGTPGAVISRRDDAQLGASVVTFANGTRLIVKPTAFEKDVVRVSAALGGGRASVPTGLTHALWATEMTPFGGTGKLPYADVLRYAQNTGTAMSVALAEGPTLTQLNGVTRTKDFASQMQLLAAYARDPGFRAEGDEKVAQIGPLISSQIGGNVLSAFIRARGVVLAGDQPRFADLPTDAEIAATRPGEIAALVRPQLSGPAEVTVVGAVTVDQAIAITAATFGAGPKLAATPVPHPRIAMPQGRAEPYAFTHGGRADQAVYGMYWPMPDYFADPATADAGEVLANVIKQRLVDSVREKLGMTYSPITEAQAARQLVGYGYVGALIETPEANFVKFRQIVLDQVADLAAKPIGTDELLRSQQTVVEGRRKSLERNEYWVATLPLVLRDPRTRQSVLARVSAAQAVTAAQIQRIVRMRMAGKVPVTVVIKSK